MGERTVPTGDVRSQADAAGYSLRQYHRRFRHENGEAPMTVSRRLRLERAAYELSRSRRTASEIALDAGYDSLAGFGRAFRRVFGLTPSEYRARRVTEYRFDLTERLHYAPSDRPHSLAETTMNPMLKDLVRDHHAAVASILARLQEQPALRDAPLAPVPSAFPWMPDPKTLGDAAGNLFQGDPWLHAINGVKWEGAPLVPERNEWSRDEFFALLDTIEAEGLWEMTFVDRDCTPPEVFSYGSVVRMAVTMNAYYRVLVESHLARLGHETEHRAFA